MDFPRSFLRISIMDLGTSWGLCWALSPMLAEPTAFKPYSWQRMRTRERIKGESPRKHIIHCLAYYKLSNVVQFYYFVRVYIHEKSVYTIKFWAEEEKVRTTELQVAGEERGTQSCFHLCSCQHQARWPMSAPWSCWLASEQGLDPWHPDAQVRVCFNTQWYPGDLHQQYQGSGNRLYLKPMCISDAPVQHPPYWRLQCGDLVEPVLVSEGDPFSDVAVGGRIPKS